MIRLARLFPNEAIVVTLSRQLSWSHVHALLPIKDPLARDFYAKMSQPLRTPEDISADILAPEEKTEGASLRDHRVWLKRTNGIKMIDFAFADCYRRAIKLNNTRPASAGFGRYAHRAGYFFWGTESYEIR
jgi:hypothetical protein